MTAVVYWQDTVHACFIVTDFNRGNGDFNVCGRVSGIPYDHTSAEWINESHFGQLDSATNTDITYYDSPGTVSWIGQEVQGAFNDTGSFVNPFPAGQAEIMTYGTSWNGGTSCGQAGVLSVPVNAGTAPSGLGSSQIITCHVSGVD
jgi:hypothetical protein